LSNNESLMERDRINRRFFLFALFFTAAVVRLAWYFLDRSIWQDEAPLVLNVLDRSFTGLTLPLSGQPPQFAPVGFLFIEKALVMLLGPSEYALRLFPLICSLASLFIFYRLAARFLSRRGLALAMIFMGFYGPFIANTVEIKPYSSDVFIALSALAIFLRVRDRDYSRVSLAIFAGFGVLAVWMSFTAVLVLAPLSVFLIFGSRHDKKKPGSAALFSALWIISFAVYYWFFLSGAQVSALTSMQNLWFNEKSAGSLAGYVPSTNTQWNLWAWQLFFAQYLAVPWPPAVLAVLIGVLRLNRDDRRDGSILIAFFAAALIFHWSRLYPLYARLALFLVPFIFILLAEGYDFVMLKTVTFWRGAPVVVTLLVCCPLVLSSQAIYLRYETRAPVEYIKENLKPGDRVFVLQEVRDVFEYYAREYKLSYQIACAPADAADFGDAPVKDRRRFIFTRGQRIWLYLSHYDQPPTAQEMHRLIRYLKGRTHLVRQRAFYGTEVLLLEAR